MMEVSLKHVLPHSESRETLLKLIRPRLLPSKVRLNRRNNLFCRIHRGATLAGLALSDLLGLILRLACLPRVDDTCLEGSQQDQQ